MPAGIQKLAEQSKETFLGSDLSYKHLAATNNINRV
jgi:hypothetical protein